MNLSSLQSSNPATQAESPVSPTLSYPVLPYESGKTKPSLPSERLVTVTFRLTEAAKKQGLTEASIRKNRALSIPALSWSSLEASLEELKPFFLAKIYEVQDELVRSKVNEKSLLEVDTPAQVLSSVFEGKALFEAIAESLESFRGNAALSKEAISFFFLEVVEAPLALAISIKANPTQEHNPELDAKILKAVELRGALLQALAAPISKLILSKEKQEVLEKLLEFIASIPQASGEEVFEKLSAKMLAFKKAQAEKERELEEALSMDF